METERLPMDILRQLISIILLVGLTTIYQAVRRYHEVSYTCYRSRSFARIYFYTRFAQFLGIRWVVSYLQSPVG